MSRIRTPLYIRYVDPDIAALERMSKYYRNSNNKISDAIDGVIELIRDKNSPTDTTHNT